MKSKVSVLELIVETSRQLDMLNISCSNRTFNISKGNYKKLCKEIGVNSCNKILYFKLNIIKS